jgi:hypothetical protein
MQIPEEQTENVIPETGSSNERPVGLTLLLIFSFVYNGILFMLMTTGLLYPEVIREILLQYFPAYTLPFYTAFLFMLGGTLVFALSLVSLVLLWKQRRLGFYLFAPAQVVVLSTLVFVLKSYDYVNISIALVILILFGLYSRSMK